MKYGIPYVTAFTACTIICAGMLTSFATTSLVNWTLPLWLLGGALGVSSIVIGLVKKIPWTGWILIGGFGLISLGAVVYSHLYDFRRSDVYYRDMHLQEQNGLYHPTP